MKNDQEYIWWAAIQRSDGVVVCGRDHAECISKFPVGTCKAGSEQGFMTSLGRFVGRVDAGEIAWAAGQIRSDPKGAIILSEEIWRDGNCFYDESSGYVLKKSSDDQEDKQSKGEAMIKLPDGWFVYEAGQNPLHLLWFAQLINIEDMLSDDGATKKNPRRVWVEEKDTFEEALEEAIHRIKCNNFVVKGE